ncbi:MAG: hypothetical protein R3321_01015 [Nitrososphaeraceae archaeon]|nr:hypothetical protein [Nitrososphaeraceae archaeon]
MIYEFNKVSDIYKRIFIGETTSFWNGRPIYDRLPSANQQYNTSENRFNDEGNVLLKTIPNATQFGEGSLQVEIENRYLLKINSGAITWADGETFLKEFYIGVSSDEDTEWKPSINYSKGDIVYDSDGILYTVQEDYQSDVLITFDLQNGKLFRGALGAGEQYVWLELFRYRPSAVLRVSIPDKLLDIATVTASRSSILNPARFALDPDSDKAWAPPNSLNSNDSLIITFDGTVELEDFKLYSTFNNGPTAKLSYKSSNEDSFIVLTGDVLQDSSGVWDFPINFINNVVELKIEFTGAFSLDVNNYEITGNWLQTGQSSIRNQFVAFRTSDSYDMDDLNVLGSCVLAQVVVDDFGEISQINDTRSLTYDRNESVADWLTVYWDELLLNTRSKLDNFLIDQLNPLTAGDYFYEEIVTGLTINDNNLEVTNTPSIISPFGILE